MTLISNWQNIKEQIPTSVKLVAVSKQQSVSDIQILYQAGQITFGENRIDELIQKKTALVDCQIEWHFVGKIQSNKTRLIAENCDWVQSLDNIRHATRLNEQRPVHLKPLAICIQVNISQESQKSGIHPNQLSDFAQELTQFNRLKFCGLMAIIENTTDLEKINQQFHAMHKLFLALKQQGFSIDTLSMGMSQDYLIAIQAGATMIRIGNALFG